jgi:hypothetical protein
MGDYSQGKSKDSMKAANLCRIHAETCTECFIPIMDEEGNPQFVSEACAKGAELLRTYRKMEANYFNGKGNGR